MLSQENIDNIISTIGNVYQPDKILLFGSYALGEATIDSDLDLLIIKESSKPRIERALELRKLLRKHKFTYPIDLLVYTPDEIQAENLGKNSFINRVMREGKVVYE
jgi:uncharacterized protein